VRFLVKDLIDLRASKWVPRREATRAKKIDEIHAEAEQALGVQIPKAGDFAAMGRGGGRDVELFPALRSEAGATGGSKYTHKTGTGDVSSGLLGEFVPKATPPVPTGNADLTEEELARKTKSLIEEFVQVGDEKELLICVAEIQAPHLESMTKLTTDMAMTMIDQTSERDQGMVLKLAGVLSRKGLVAAKDVQDGLSPLLGDFADLALDYPHAPRLLGSMVGAFVADGVLPITAFPALLLPIEDAAARRDLALYAINHLRSRHDDARLGAMFRENGISGAAFLAHDPGFDGDLPDVSDWLKEHDLSFIPA